MIGETINHAENIKSFTCQYQASWAQPYPDTWTAETNWPGSGSNNRLDNEGLTVGLGTTLDSEKFRAVDTVAGMPAATFAVQLPAMSYHTCFQ